MWGFVIFLFLFALFKIWDLSDRKKEKQRAYSDACPPPEIDETDIYFHGSELHLDNISIHNILAKRYSYYQGLESRLQEKFVRRLRNFMRRKFFIIKDKRGVKEMPVLASATAIQLTFGLNDYLLPFYRYIRIYPEEYLSDHSFAVLAGNVQNNVISIAWSQLLKGCEDATDGSNVGLHEMSHALYTQKIILEGDYEKKFSNHYDKLVSECTDASKKELDGVSNVYSEYADTNLQEFWAETVELFFEKPEELKRTYPQVFEAMTLLMNQDPRNRQNPVIENHVSFSEKLKRIFYRKEQER